MQSVAGRDRWMPPRKVIEIAIDNVRERRRNLPLTGNHRQA
jgi:hypothetical protein